MHSGLIARVYLTIASKPITEEHTTNEHVKGVNIYLPNQNLKEKRFILGSLVFSLVNNIMFSTIKSNGPSSYVVMRLYLCVCVYR